MSLRTLIAALTCIGLAFGGTALATPGDAPLKKVEVDKTGHVTKTDGAVKKAETKKAPPRKIVTSRPAPGRTGDKTLKPTKAGTAGKRAPMATKRMHTQDIKPAPKVERGTKPSTGTTPTKRDTTTKVDKATTTPATSRVGAGDDERVKTVDKKPIPAKDVPVKRDDTTIAPAGPVKRAPK